MEDCKMVVRNNITGKEQTISTEMWDKLNNKQKQAFTVVNASDEAKDANVVVNKVTVKPVANGSKRERVAPDNGEKKK